MSGQQKTQHPTSTEHTRRHLIPNASFDAQVPQGPSVSPPKKNDYKAANAIVDGVDGDDVLNCHEQLKRRMAALRTLSLLGIGGHHNSKESKVYMSMSDTSSCDNISDEQLESLPLPLIRRSLHIMITAALSNSGDATSIRDLESIASGLTPNNTPPPPPKVDPTHNREENDRSIIVPTMKLNLLTLPVSIVSWILGYCDANQLLSSCYLVSTLMMNIVRQPASSPSMWSINPHGLEMARHVPSWFTHSSTRLRSLISTFARGIKTQVPELNSWLLKPTSPSLIQWRNHFVQHIDARTEPDQRLDLPLLCQIWPLCTSLRSLTLEGNRFFDLSLLTNHPTLERIHVALTPFIFTSKNPPSSWPRSIREYSLTTVTTLKLQSSGLSLLPLSTTPIRLSSRLIDVKLSSHMNSQDPVILDLHDAVKLERLYCAGHISIHGAINARSLTSITLSKETMGLTESQSITHVALSKFGPVFISSLLAGHKRALMKGTASSIQRWLHLDLKTADVSPIFAFDSSFA
jgi:hypothetical protein